MWIIHINLELLLFTNKHNIYSFLSTRFHNNNIINNHAIKITHYQIFVVVYQTQVNWKFPHHEEMYDYDIYWLCSDMIIIIT